MVLALSLRRASAFTSTASRAATFVFAPPMIARVSLRMMPTSTLAPTPTAPMPIEPSIESRSSWFVAATLTDCAVDAVAASFWLISAPPMIWAVVSESMISTETAPATPT